MMITTYGITLSVAYYGCLVDLLGRAGQLQEAVQTINDMPMKPNSTVWGSLLRACRVYKNVAMVELVCYRLLALDPENGASYVMLSNISSQGQGDDDGPWNQGAWM